MQKRVSLFLYSIFLSVLFFNPIEIYALKNKVFVSAVVLEHLTYVNSRGSQNITTNYRDGYWELFYKENKIFIVRF